MEDKLKKIGKMRSGEYYGHIGHIGRICQCIIRPKHDLMPISVGICLNTMLPIELKVSKQGKSLKRLD